MTQLVIGLDLSLASTGVAWFTDDGQAGWANPKTKPGASHLVGRWERLVTQISAVEESLPNCCSTPYCPCHMPKLSGVVVEAPSYGSQGGMAHERGHLWWAVVDNLIGRNTRVAEASPKQRAKYGCGNGNGDKKAVREAVRATYGDLFDRRIPNDDVADAVALAGLAARLCGWPVEPETLTHHTAVAEVIRW